MPAETHSRRGPVDPDEVRRVMRERLAEILGIDDALVSPDARLREDLGADDLALIELVEALADEFGERTVEFSIDDEDLADLVTVHDTVEYALAQLGPRGVGPMIAPLDDAATLEDALGFRFADRSLLLRALSHRSWCAENDCPDSNERLEFLGDSVLGLVVTDHVFRLFPHVPEGELSEVRAGVVNARVLAEVASEMGLGSHLLLGKGEDAAGGREKQSILADAFEAVIASVYLDGGWAEAEGVVLRFLGDRIGEAASGPGGRDYKTRLQEMAAQEGLGRPRYAVRDEGPDHAKRFFATVHLGGEPFGEGEGQSKKEAERAAAWVAWCHLREQGGRDAGVA